MKFSYQKTLYFFIEYIWKIECLKLEQCYIRYTKLQSFIITHDLDDGI